MAIVYSYYVNDLIHKGHRLQMRNAKGFAGPDGISIVGILTKEAVLERKLRKPVINFDERMQTAQDLSYVDVVIPQKTYSPLDNLRMLKPDIHLESDSHDIKDIESDKKNKKLFIISNGIISTRAVWIEAIILSSLSFLRALSRACCFL